jgi:hypothetical protein
MLKVFSQLPYAEKNGLIDDCGPSALAAGIYYSSNGAQNPGVDGAISAAAKAGRKDTNGKSEGTTFVQIVKAATFLKQLCRDPGDSVQIWLWRRHRWSRSVPVYIPPVRQQPLDHKKSNQPVVA